MDQVGQLLVPLGSVFLMVKQQLSVLLVPGRALGIQFSLLLLPDFPLFLQFLLVLLQLQISFLLDTLQLILKPAQLVLQLLGLLLVGVLVLHLVSGNELESVRQVSFLPLHLLQLLVQLQHCLLVLFILLLHALLQLLLQLSHNHVVVRVLLRLVVVLLLRDLVHRLLEFLRGFVQVFLVLVLLLLEELVLAFPERNFLVVLVDFILQSGLEFLDLGVHQLALLLIGVGLLSGLLTELVVRVFELLVLGLQVPFSEL